MEYQALMTAIIGITKKLSGWLEAAQQIHEAEKSGGPVSADLRAKARAAGNAAQAAMDATP